MVPGRNLTGRADHRNGGPAAQTVGVAMLVIAQLNLIHVHAGRSIYYIRGVFDTIPRGGALSVW